MKASFIDRLAKLGINVDFVNDCISRERLAEQDVLVFLVSFCHVKEEIQAFNRKVWRLRNLHRRNFDVASFTPAVLRGLGFDDEVIAKAVQTGKATQAEVEQMVASVCRDKCTVAAVYEELAPETTDGLIDKLGFDREILFAGVQYGRKTWAEIAQMVASAARGETTVDEVESNLVTIATERMSFARADQLTNRLDRKRLGEIRLKAA